MTILLIDDDVIGTKVRAELLTLHKYSVLCARDGEEGLAIFADHSVDLVIVDAVMPKMDGKEFLRRLAAISPMTPTLLLSGSFTVPGTERGWLVLPTLTMTKGEGALRLLESIRSLTPIPVCHEVSSVAATISA